MSKTLLFAWAILSVSLAALPARAKEADSPEPSCLGMVASTGIQSINRDAVAFSPHTIDLDEVNGKLGVKRELNLVELITKDGKGRTEAEIFNDGPADLIIGIDVEGNTEGHMYLGIRDDSQPSGEGKKGVVHQWTCVASACYLLFDIGGFANAEEFGKPWFPGTFLQRLSHAGLVGADGVRLVPEIYTLNRDHESFWNNLPRWRRVLKFIVPVLKNPATWGKKSFDAASPETGEGSDSLRFDGRLFKRDNEVTRRTWRLSNGLIIRYRHIPDDIRKRMLDFLNSGG